MTALMAAAETVDRNDENYDQDDVVEHFLGGLIDLDADTRLVWQGDELIAYSAVLGQRQVREVHSVWLSGTVRPDYRRCGLGRQLLGWQLARAQQLHADRHPLVEANIMCLAHDTNAGLAALARAEGLEQLRFWFDMVRPLDDARAPAPPVRTADGIRIEPYDSARDNEVRLAHNTAFHGHFGSTERDPEEWQGFFTGSRAFRPDLSLLALADDAQATIAGYLLAYVFDGDVQASGRRAVHVGQLGTLASFRGRGVGFALMTTGLANWTAAGHQQAWLGVDAANATGALGLYERAGFTVHKRSTSWARRLPART